MDDFIRERLEDPDSKKAEALAWLEASGAKNTLGELPTTKASIALVKEAYKAGAEEVLAVEIDEFEGVGNTGKLIVRLPSDPEERKRAFKWCGKLAEKSGFDAEQDTGQTHLFIMLD